MLDRLGCTPPPRAALAWTCTETKASANTLVDWHAFKLLDNIVGWSAEWFILSDSERPAASFRPALVACVPWQVGEGPAEFWQPPSGRARRRTRKGSAFQQALRDGAASDGDEEVADECSDEERAGEDGDDEDYPTNNVATDAHRSRIGSCAQDRIAIRLGSIG